MGPMLRRIESRIRCLLGDHELVTDTVPANPDEGTKARLRLRCLWCHQVTPGWEQGSPAYRRTYDGKNQTLRNPKLDAIRAADAAAEPVAASGGGLPADRARNVTNFTVAKGSRLR